VHDIIGDVLDWDEAHKAYLAGEGETGERYSQRLEAANLMLASGPLLQGAAGLSDGSLPPDTAVWLSA